VMDCQASDVDVGDDELVLAKTDVSEVSSSCF
jgi:hypothetical protein